MATAYRSVRERAFACSPGTAVTPLCDEANRHENIVNQEGEVSCTRSMGGRGLRRASRKRTATALGYPRELVYSDWKVILAEYILNQSWARCRHAALSAGLSALSAFTRHSSAFLRHLSGSASRMSAQRKTSGLVASSP